MLVASVADGMENKPAVGAGMSELETGVGVGAAVGAFTGANSEGDDAALVNKLPDVVTGAATGAASAPVVFG